MTGQNDRQGKNLIRQLRIMARQCPLTSRYFMTCKGGLRGSKVLEVWLSIHLGKHSQTYSLHSGSYYQNHGCCLSVIASCFHVKTDVHRNVVAFLSVCPRKHDAVFCVRGSILSFGVKCTVSICRLATLLYFKFQQL